jgi:hypothetical protein
VKLLKFLGIGVAAVLALAVALAYLYRERLATEAVDRVLAGSGFTVADIGFARFGTRELRLSRIELAGADGSLYVAKDVVLNLDLARQRVAGAMLGSLDITPAAAEASSPAVADLLDMALGLHDDLPGLEVRIDRLSHPALPPIRSLHWQAAPPGQRATFSIDGVGISATVAGGAVPALALSAGPEEAAILDLGIEFSRAAAGYAANGRVSFETGRLASLLRDKSLLALEQLDISGRYTGEVAASIETDAPGLVSIAISDASVEPLVVRRTSDDGTGPGFETSDLRLARFDFSYPSREWHAAFGNFTGTISSGYAARATVRIDNLECRPATRCRATTRLDAERIRLAAGSADAFRARGDAELSIAGGELTATLVPTSLAGLGIAAGDWQADEVTLAAASGFVAALDARDLRIEADSLTLDVAGTRSAGGLAASGRLELAQLRYSLAEEAVTAEFSLPRKPLALSWNTHAITPFEVTGKLELAGDDGSLRANVRDPSRALVVEISAVPGPSGQTIDIVHSSIDFSAAPLSASFGKWPFDWDLLAGTASVTGKLAPATGGADGGFLGTLAFAASGIAGNYRDIGATGASAAASLELHPARAPSVDAGKLQVSLLDVGLPVRNISAGFDLDLQSKVARIDGLEMELLGGTASAGLFSVDLDNLDTAINLRVDGIQLGLIAQLADFEDIELSGALSGMIPLRMTDGRLTVETGRLANLPPGGVIRYHSEPGDAGSSLALAKKALSNLQYESLISDVAYTADGDLRLNMRLQGINPDLDPLQPVILNLGVENNIPQLLRSLQATRDIEAIIESRTRR